ncbi:hypothetical protein NG895_01165 [Aeoliella sp. ICT_H6.2]|uniref:Uncharacterized protein n=1 Tax=Aeoliella straminimaris TaxID=2954799 RepID=A0A9X2JED1_9BACT|nr:hypothetical protein [Aeoliella straminimaris]MCO6042506.1 hypothetical protein [Aeoliella straminimaris]
MPKVACPQCKKRYNVPEKAVGRYASCKCGQRFKVPAPPPPETKKSDSLWDELDDEYEVEPPSSPSSAVARPTAVPAASPKPAAPAWHAQAQLVFRVACYVIPTLLWCLFDFWIVSSIDRKPPLLMIVFFVGALIVSLYVGWRVSAKGLSFGPDARRLRLLGLGICGAGFVGSLAALVAASLIAQTLPGGMLVALLVLGVGFVAMIAGGLQWVTGRTLWSQISSSDRG